MTESVDHSGVIGTLPDAPTTLVVITPLIGGVARW